MAIQGILKEVVQEIAPTREEKADVEQKVMLFKRILMKAKLPDIFVGGSFAKGTWLRGITDVDIFIRFPYEQFKSRSAEISELLEVSLRKLFSSVERVHGSRDYFRIPWQGLKFELVPILKITKAAQAVNITDISPLHVQWVRKNITPCSRQAVLLLKALLAANGLYGAESYVKGFSGYATEILGVYYGDFLKLLKAVTKWKPGIVIDPENAYANPEEAVIHLNASKLGPVVLIDPVQATRNAAAALSKEAFRKFVRIVKQFLKKPSKGFFQPKIMTKAKLGKGVWLELTPLDAKEDIAGAKLLSCFKYLERKVHEYGFTVADKGWQWQPGRNAQMWFRFKGKLKKQYEVAGPPLSKRANVESFKRKHKNCFVKQERIFAIETRRFTEPESYIKHLIKDGYIKSRVARIVVK